MEIMMSKTEVSCRKSDEIHKGLIRLKDLRLRTRPSILRHVSREAPHGVPALKKLLCALSPPFIQGIAVGRLQIKFGSLDLFSADLDSAHRSFFIHMALIMRFHHGSEEGRE